MVIVINFLRRNFTCGIRDDKFVNIDILLQILKSTNGHKNSEECLLIALIAMKN